MPPQPPTPVTPLRALFPGGVFVAEFAGTAEAHDLLPAEQVAVAQAVESRVQQFTAGRLCARHALKQMNGLEASALVAGPDRVPLWPSGITGSITHTEGLAAAVVAQRADYQGLGIDIEPRGAVRERLWAGICRDEEVAWLRSLPTACAGEAATLLFCAKEAFYKAQYAAVSEWVGFDDVRIALERDSDTHGRFVVEPRRELKILGQLAGPIAGRWLLRGEFAAAGLALPA